MMEPSCTSKANTENISGESFAYLQRVIENPETAIVQQHIQGNIAKMLIVSLNGEQRLITFDIPMRDCTVQDLLDQIRVNVPFASVNIISLVKDTLLGINYIVEVLSVDPNEQIDPEKRIVIREYLDDIFRSKGKIYDGSSKMVHKFFEWACVHDRETAKALIFPGSPVLSAVVTPGKDSFLHCLCESTQPSATIAQILIDFGINIDAKNADGKTALHIAAEKFNDLQLNDNIVRVLLKNGANREIRDKHGLTPIDVSLFSGNLEVAEEFLKEEDKLPNVIKVDKTERCRHLVKCLLQEKDHWNIPSTNYSILLHFLLLNHEEEISEYVLKNTKFDINAICLAGKTLLHTAAEKNMVRMIRALISLGANPNAKNKKCKTPLIIAIEKTQTESFYCLLDSGASVKEKQEIDRETISPLHYAICLQSLEMVEKLVKLGADVNEATYRCSPLLLACGSIYSKKWLREPDELFHVFSKETGVNYDDIYKFPFSLKIVEILLDHGADTEAKTATNRTALDQACRFGNLDTVKLLLSRGAKINQGDVSTLHHAVKGENLAVVKLILEQGANVNYRCEPERIFWDDPYSESPPPRTPLECAVNFIQQDSLCKKIIEIFMEYGVNFNVEPIQRETLLHLACHSDKKNYFLPENCTSRPATIQLLLRNNVDVNIIDDNGMTPLQYTLRDYTSYNNASWNTTRDFKPNLVTLIAFLAKMIEKKEYVIMENLKLLENETICPIYQECMNELSLMKKNICESRNFSFYNILCNDIQYLGSTLKDENVLQILNSGEYKKNFPIYSEYLEDRIREATVRQTLVDLVIVHFQKHINKNIAIELILYIFKFQNLYDLKNFAKACFVDVKSAFN